MWPLGSGRINAAQAGGVKDQQGSAPRDTLGSLTRCSWQLVCVVQSETQLVLCLGNLIQQNKLVQSLRS